MIAAVIIEPEGEPKKILRVTLPLGMQLTHGTRIIVDSNQPQQAPYVICFQNGCMSDYEATPEIIANLKKGQNLVVQAINSNGAPLTLPLPLAGEFAKAYDGPPTDPKVFEENQKKLQEELQKAPPKTRARSSNRTSRPARSPIRRPVSDADNTCEKGARSGAFFCCGNAGFCCGNAGLIQRRVARTVGA